MMRRWVSIPFWTTTGVLSITGVGLIWTKFFQEKKELFSVVNHPWEPYMLKTHVFFAPVWMFFFGLVISDHVVPKLRRQVGLGKRSGLANLFLTVPMIVSGYLIQVLSSIPWLKVMSQIHLWTGVIFFLAFLFHSLSTLWRKAKQKRKMHFYLASMKRNFGILLILGVLVLSVFGCHSKTPAKPSNESSGLYEQAWPMMGTTLQIQFWLKPDSSTGVFSKQKANELASDIYLKTEKINQLISIYLPDSEISLINKRAGSGIWTPVDALTLELIRKSIDVNQKSDGLFDVTVGPLVELWQFGAAWHGDQLPVPSDSEIEKALALLGVNRIQINGAEKAVRLSRNGMKLDFGSIGKGFALDKIVEELENRADVIDGAIVQLGGQVAVFGRPPDDGAWKVGIRDPNRPGHLVGFVEIERGSVATSASYDRFFVHNGETYSHILNPLTGWAARSGASVTVWAPSATDADAWSTAFYLADENLREQWVRAVPSLGVIRTESGSVERIGKIKFHESSLSQKRK